MAYVKERVESLLHWRHAIADDHNLFINDWAFMCYVYCSITWKRVEVLIRQSSTTGKCWKLLPAVERGYPCMIFRKEVHFQL